MSLDIFSADAAELEVYIYSMNTVVSNCTVLVNGFLNLPLYHEEFKRRLGYYSRMPKEISILCSFPRI